MLGVIEAVTQEARNGTYLRDKTLAHWIAMNVVTEQRLQTAPPPVAESSDDVEFAGQRWHWTMRGLADAGAEPAAHGRLGAPRGLAPTTSRSRPSPASTAAPIGPAGGVARRSWNGTHGRQPGDERTTEPGDEPSRASRKRPAQPTGAGTESAHDAAAGGRVTAARASQRRLHVARAAGRDGDLRRGRRARARAAIRSCSGRASTPSSASTARGKCSARCRRSRRTSSRSSRARSASRSATRGCPR